jgi:hypothetical protein
MTTVYAASGGALIGLGIALLINSDQVTPWYLIPYATGLGSFTLAVEMLKKRNATQAFLPVKNKGSWNFALMPQNLYLNNKMQNNGFMTNGRLVGMQPVFAASLTF